MALAHIRIDTKEIANVERVFREAGPKAPIVIARALNRTGDMTVTQVVRALTEQTGLKRKTIVKAVKKKRARVGALRYELKSRGGNVALKYFGARETRRGVSAAPWNARKVFPGTFMRGGRFPARVALKMGGHAFARTGASRLPIAKQKSGLFIPNEMVEGKTAEAFLRTVHAVLPARLQHELAVLLGGIAP
jgi:hypothetical protein